MVARGEARRLTRTEAAICEAAQALCGVAAEAAAAALAAPGEEAPADRLVREGLIEAQAVDAVLEAAFEQVRADGDRWAARLGGEPPERAAPGEEAPALDGAAARRRVAALVRRLDAILAGELRLRLRPEHAEARPPAPERTPVAAPEGDEPSAEPPPLVANTGLPAPRPPEGLDEEAAAAWVRDQAFARWARAARGLAEDALEAARSLSASSLPEALVLNSAIDLVDSMEALADEQPIACACGAVYQLGHQLLPYAYELLCPRCVRPLVEARLGISKTVVFEPGGARPVSYTELPGYAQQAPLPAASLTGRPDYAGESGFAKTIVAGSRAAPRPRPRARGTAPTRGAAGADPDGLAGLERYEILGELARGGMGIVYKARQRGLGRTVCLKVMRSAGLADFEERRRFLREAEAAARLDHPGIVPVYDVGEAGGQAYFSMQFIDGKELGVHVRDAASSAREVCQLMAKVCEAIHYAHQRGVIHRDLKPANVMVDRAGAPHVMDFGIAKTLDTGEGGGRGPMTREGEIMGTPHYMAPEQAEGKVSEIDVRTDVYALGVIAYELLTGRRPFQSDNLITLLKMVSNQEPEPLRAHRPELDPELETIVLKALEKEKERRYQTAAALGADLARWLRGEAVEARRATLAYRARKWAARNRAAAASAAVGVAGMLLLVGLWAAAEVGERLERRRRIAARLEEAGEQLRRGRADAAFTTYGRVLMERPDDAAARAGRVEAALRVAEAALRELRPGEAEAALTQVDYLGVRSDEVAAALDDARAERRRLLEVGVERQRRAVRETEAALEQLRGLAEPASFEEEQGFVFDLVRHRDPETIRMLRDALRAAGPGQETLARVVLRALGWMRAEEAVPELAAVLADRAREVSLRYAAADALGWIGGSDAWAALLAAREREGAAFRRRTQAAVRRVAAGLDQAPRGEDAEGERPLAEADRLRQAGEREAAVAAYDAALAAAPDAVEGYFGRAAALLALGRLPEAEADLDRVVEAGGRTLEPARLNRAEVRRRRGDLAGALDDLAALLLLDPERADAYLARGRIELQRGEVEAACGALDRALELEPGLSDALATRAEARLAARDPARALSDADAAVASDPRRPELLLVRARVHLARGDAAAAEADARAAIGLRPSPHGYRLLARALERGGDAEAALDVLREGAAAVAAPGLALDEARLLLALGRAAEARAAAAHLLGEGRGASEDERRDGLTLRGVAALRLGDVAAAVADLAEVAQLAPTRADAHYNLACALAQAGQERDALRALERALSLGHAREGLRRDPDLAPLAGVPAFERLADGEEGE